MASTRRKSAALALAVVGVAGLTLASAAQLNVNSASLGAGTDIVAACDDDGIDVTFTNGYSADEATYLTSAVTLGDVATACVGNDLRITLADADGASLAEITTTVAAGGPAYSLTSAVDAELVESVSVVISG
ncbi:hypothetical protein [Actinotalea sp. K2]|uniref:hypothetical protein n=1 Tax=Actinotalea sp. K2 TaxID=2939438 RepID=UPI00201792B5|nr:hypothetical protein [Actinotalea sp. K2]MCL3861509.1 hypothetical protein [Actinotalea sp. K2]